MEGEVVAVDMGTEFGLARDELAMLRLKRRLQDRPAHALQVSWSQDHKAEVTFPVLAKPGLRSLRDTVGKEVNACAPMGIPFERLAVEGRKFVLIILINVVLLEDRRLAAQCWIFQLFQNGVYRGRVPLVGQSNFEEVFLEL